MKSFVLKNFCHNKVLSQNFVATKKFCHNKSFVTKKVLSQKTQFFLRSSSRLPREFRPDEIKPNQIRSLLRERWVPSKFSLASLRRMFVPVCSFPYLRSRIFVSVSSFPYLRSRMFVRSFVDMRNMLQSLLLSRDVT
jgi:hypothetical protein